MRVECPPAGYGFSSLRLPRKHGKERREGFYLSGFEEYDEIRYFIREKFEGDRKRMSVLFGIMMRLQYDSCLSCCRILPPSEARSFARKAAAEFESDVERGHAAQKYFPSFDWNLFSTWVYDPEKFMDIFERGRKPSLLSRFRKVFKHSKDV